MTSEDWLIIPVRSFVQAKSRLAGHFSLEQRSALARAMLLDVLDAVKDVKNLVNIAMVSGSDDITSLAMARGVSVITDGGAAGTNAAVAVGLRDLETRCAGTVVIIAGDVPAIAAADVEALFDGARTNGVAIAPAIRDGGTNALALASPLCIPTYFGPDSFRRHRQAAAASGINPAIVENIRLGNDIDKPADIAALLNLDLLGQNTGRFLKSLPHDLLAALDSSSGDRLTG